MIGSLFSSRTRPRLAVIAFYVGLAALMLYNPLRMLPDHVPTVPDGSTSDYYHFHWNYGWIGYALGRGLPVYETEYVLAPFVSSLGLHTLTPIGWPLWALITPVFGTAAGMAAVMGALLALAGIACYGLLRTQGVGRGWALIGGAVLQTSPLLVNGVYWTNLNIMGWFWLPVLLIVWGRIVGHTVRYRRGRRLAWIGLLGTSVWGMGLTDPQFFLLTLPVLIPYGVYTLAAAGSWKARLRLIDAVITAGGLALALLILAGPLPAILAFDTSTLAPTPADRAVAAIGFPECYVWHCDRGVPVGAVVLPLLAAALIYAALRRRGTASGEGSLNIQRAPVWLWLACVPVPLVLSAGASIALAGQTLDLPYTLLHDALGGMFRYPERFAPAFVIPALIVIARLLPRLRGGATAGLLLIVLADGRVLHPVPVMPLPPAYAMHRVMAAEPVRYVVVDVPTAGMSGEGLVGDARWPATQFYGLAHGQRMVNGHISRVDTWHFMWMRDGDPLMSWLGVRRPLDVDAATAQLAERIPLWPIGYLVVHDRLIGRETAALGEIYGFLNGQGDLLCPPILEGEAAFYRTRWLAAQPGVDTCPARTPPLIDGAYMLDIGATTDRAHVGWGWYPAEAFGGIDGRWMGAIPLNGGGDPAPVRLFLDLPPAAYTLTLTAQSYHAPRTVTVMVNETVIGTVSVRPDALAAYTLPVPASVLDSGDVGNSAAVTITLSADGAARPADVTPGSTDTRALIVLVDQVQLGVNP